MEQNYRDETGWVSDEMASLGAPRGWEPDIEDALKAIHRRADDRSVRRRAWVCAGISAAAVSLALVALLSIWSHNGLTAERSAAAAGRQSTSAVFDGSMLRYPEDYRKWVYVGTSLGLAYSEGGDASGERPELFQNVYIDPVSYDSYQTTGEFPEGTVMVLEVASSEEGNEPGLRGRYQGEIVGIEASVKDTSRFPTGWAYFSFTGRSGERRDIAQAFPEASCWTCHDEEAETDHVFTQFYPVLSIVLF